MFMWVTCFVNLKNNSFFPVFLVQFWSSCPQPEFQLLVFSFFLLHCDMTYLVLVTVGLLGGQQAHGQLIWAVTGMVTPQDTVSWPVCVFQPPAHLDHCP